MNDHRIAFDDLDWQTPAVGVREKSRQVGGRHFRLVEFSPAFREEGWCERGHAGFVLEGRLEIDFEGTRISYGQGDALCIPAGPEHRHAAIVQPGEMALLMLIDDV